MADVTIPDLSDEAYRALNLHAAQNDRSVEAEILAILEAAVRPEGRLRLGTALAAIGQKHGVNSADIEALEQVRDPRAAAPIDPG
ncbi:FitA-like ribbon-helix-helix domain-containing protein [Methylobrevis albus]|uniref:Plasmid stabilization protein n=1 Tax=Methylobrevis albus TaxID=2793297 RepID=A0A931I3Y4_9HYPH|nr:plasmid stabilization protein [Methylobrevis albus]MBH0239805.1 plasmid stabilization protein [Methylobrevis albus]